MRYKKQRGQRSKLRRLIKAIDRIEPYWQEEDGYEHFHVPCRWDFLDSPKTYRYARRLFICKWLEKAERLAAQKPKDLPFCKVVVGIYEKCLWESQITIFYDEAYYKSFFNRKTPEQTWLEIEGSPSLADQRGIKSCFKEICYMETIQDEEEVFEGRIWFYIERENNI